MVVKGWMAFGVTIQLHVSHSLAQKVLEEKPSGASPRYYLVPTVRGGEQRAKGAEEFTEVCCASGKTSGA